MIKIGALVLLLVFAPVVAQAQETDTLTVRVGATVVAYADYDDCQKDDSLPGCELFVEDDAEPEHFCMTHPDAVGCRYYQPAD